VNDITESARMREELTIRATFDALTGCYSRASVIAALDDALSADDDRMTAVIFIDLDKFKPVNDELGHAAGDELLVRVADSIKRLLRADDIVGRLGGDEFLIVCQRLEEPGQPLAIAERVADLLHREFKLSIGTVAVCASIGVASSHDGATGESLVARADSAMYESKQQGRGRPVIFDEDGTPTHAALVPVLSPSSAAPA
jgi:diguanylate cyclase (GGDEF)-like protein